MLGCGSGAGLALAVTVCCFFEVAMLGCVQWGWADYGCHRVLLLYPGSHAGVWAVGRGWLWLSKVCCSMLLLLSQRIMKCVEAPTLFLPVFSPFLPFSLHQRLTSGVGF